MGTDTETVGLSETELPLNVALHPLKEWNLVWNASSEEGGIIGENGQPLLQRDCCKAPMADPPQACIFYNQNHTL